jgi:hypothetical protein
MARVMGQETQWRLRLLPVLAAVIATVDPASQYQPKILQGLRENFHYIGNSVSRDIELGMKPTRLEGLRNKPEHLQALFIEVQCLLVAVQIGVAGVSTPLSPEETHTNNVPRFF